MVSLTEGTRKLSFSLCFDKLLFGTRFHDVFDHDIVKILSVFCIQLLFAGFCFQGEESPRF